MSKQRTDAEKAEHYKIYGWTCSEDNLNTLPDDADPVYKSLAEWLTLEGRRSSLEEWLGCVAEDGRIHGKFNGIGAWTHRMSHKNPNQANIFSPWDEEEEPKTPVEVIKARYDTRMRALWKTDKLLVGTDAAGIQLRVLCHYMQSEEYREAILNGRKEDKTDIHSVNQRALGEICRTRGHAKTFIYAWLLGASIPKVASILQCSTSDAKDAVQNFLDSLPELRRLKESQIPSDAERSYFVGLDGRRVRCNSKHLMLAGYLQNGEAVAMKHWTIGWRKKAIEEGLWFRIVDFVHDEVQTEVQNEEDAQRLIKLQKEAMMEVNEKFNVFCPFDIESDVGYNWSVTH